MKLAQIAMVLVVLLPLLVADGLRHHRERLFSPDLEDRRQEASAPHELAVYKPAVAITVSAEGNIGADDCKSVLGRAVRGKCFVRVEFESSKRRWRCSARPHGRGQIVKCSIKMSETPTPAAQERKP